MGARTQPSVASGGQRFSSRVDARLEPVLRLAESCCYEAGHAHQVAHLAMTLFDELAQLHGLGEEHRFWLLCGALLHDIGWADGGNGHHKSSLRRIVESPLLPWEIHQRLIVGSIARYHRKALPQEDHEHFALLGRDDQADVRVLAGMLRVADALDRSHRGVVRELRCTVTEDQISIGCVTGQPAEIERVKALQKGDLLQMVFHRSLEVQWCLL